jgi:hypothetical protein
MGDYTVFVLSQRWKDCGKPQFTKNEFPQSVPYGYREKKKTERLKPHVDQRLKLVARKRF